MNLKFSSLPDKEAFKRVISDIFGSLLAVYILLLVFSFMSPGYVEFYIDMNLFLYPLIVLGAASLLFYALRLERSDRIWFNYVNKSISYAFLGLLLILAVQAIAPGFLEWGKNQFIVAVVALGTIIFYLNRDKLDEIEDETRANKIWGVKGIGRWINTEGWIYVLILFLIIVMFTAIKAPYFNVSFTSEHTMKYNAYVEPAKYMSELNDPFHFQKKYLAEPVNNPQGIFKNFENLPLLEWGLFLTYKAFPNNSLEFNTRIFTHLLGIIILIFAYIFFRKWLSKTQSLLIVFLMAINPIINKTSFDTVEDSLLVIFAFISLVYLSKFIQNHQIINLFFAGLFFGIGNIIKYSLFLWLAPIDFILLVYYSKNIDNFLKNYGILILLSLIPIISFKTSLRYLPTNAILSILGFLIWIGIFILIYSLLIKYEKRIDEIMLSIVKNKIFSFGIIIFIILSGSLFYYINNLYIFSNEFLTDSTLISNSGMYNYMLNKQFQPYMTENVYYLGLIGFLFSLFFGLKKQRILLFAFLMGSFIYWVSASKVIFFHNYYTNVIMITFDLSIAIMFNNFGKSLKNIRLLIITLLLLIIFLFPSSYDANIKRLSGEKYQDYIHQAAQYLTENTNENEIYIDDSYLLTLTILTNRARIEESGLLQNESIRNSVSEIGFSDTMKKYNISYVITTRKTPMFEKYVNLFTDEDLESVTYRRTDIILSILDKNYQYFSDNERRNQLIKEYNVKEKFFLEKEIGPYKFFRFVDNKK